MPPIEIIYGDTNFQTSSSQRQIRNIHFSVNGEPNKTTMVTLTDKKEGGIADILIREKIGQPGKKIHIELAPDQEDRSQNFHGQPIILKGK
jgi:hypothetical protein